MYTPIKNKAVAEVLPTVPKHHAGLSHDSTATKYRQGVPDQVQTISPGKSQKYSPTGIHGTFPSSISTSNPPPRPSLSPPSTLPLCRNLPCGYSCSYRNSTSDGGRSVKCFSPRTTQYMFCKQWGGLGRRKVGGWGAGALISSTSDKQGGGGAQKDEHLGGYKWRAPAPDATGGMARKWPTIIGHRRSGTGASKRWCVGHARAHMAANVDSRCERVGLLL